MKSDHNLFFLKKNQSKIKKMSTFVETVGIAYRQSYLYSTWKGRALQMSEILA